MRELVAPLLLLSITLSNSIYPNIYKLILLLLFYIFDVKKLNYFFIEINQLALLGLTLVILLLNASLSILESRSLLYISYLIVGLITYDLSNKIEITKHQFKIFIILSFIIIILQFIYSGFNFRDNSESSKNIIYFSHEPNYAISCFFLLIYYIYITFDKKIFILFNLLILFLGTKIILIYEICATLIYFKKFKYFLIIMIIFIVMISFYIYKYEFIMVGGSTLVRLNSIYNALYFIFEFPYGISFDGLTKYMNTSLHLIPFLLPSDDSKEYLELGNYYLQHLPKSFLLESFISYGTPIFIFFLFLTWHSYKSTISKAGTVLPLLLIASLFIDSVNFFSYISITVLLNKIHTNK